MSDLMSLKDIPGLVLSLWMALTSAGGVGWGLYFCPSFEDQTCLQRPGGLSDDSTSQTY